MAEDKTLTCKDCGKEFVFTTSEQDFYAKKGYENEPKRCPDCRAKRKVQWQAQRPSYPIKCAECGKEDEVPFKPSGSRPVLCKECFKKQKES